jgi:hypothetical protein
MVSSLMTDPKKNYIILAHAQRIIGVNFQKNPYITRRDKAVKVIFKISVHLTVHWSKLNLYYVFGIRGE